MTRIEAYKTERALGYAPPEALARVRAYEAGTLKSPRGQYYSAPPCSALGAPFSLASDRAAARGAGPFARWAEKPDSFARFEGSAYDICKREGWRAVEHRGWYMDESHCNETTQGVVYRLANGRGFLAGGSDAFNGGADGRGPCYLEIEACDDLYSAVLRADKLAEQYAENERDYQAAAQAGAYAGELIERAKEERAATLELCAELRELKRAQKAGAIPALDMPRTCETLRAAIRLGWREIQKFRADALKEYREHGWREPDAFAENFGRPMPYHYTSQAF